MRVTVFRKNLFVKDDIYEAENNIFLYITHKVITIIFISNEYYQFRIQYKFINTNFTRKKHIGSIAKDIEVLQTQNLRVGQVNEPCIELIQENLIENSVQYCLPYILNYHGLCYYFSSLP